MPLPEMRTGRPAASWIAPLFTAVLAAASVAPSQAQDAFPSRQITLVVPFGAGSGSDVGARLMAKELTESLGQPVVVDNRPGANGAIGAQIVARARPDGYTLLLGSATTNATNFAFAAGKLGYGPQDLTIVAGLASTPQTLWVAEDSPARSLSDLVAQAKSGRAQATCGSGNAVTQVGCELLKKQAGIDMATVTYKSNAQSIGDLAAKQIGMAFSDASAALPFVEQKKVRALAIAGERRMAQFPGTATFREQGFPGIEMTAWSAIFAPRGTPEAVLEKLNAAIRKANDTEPAIESRRRTGGTNLWMPLPEARRFVESEIARWERYVRESGVTAE